MKISTGGRKLTKTKKLGRKYLEEWTHISSDGWSTVPVRGNALILQDLVTRDVDYLEGFETGSRKTKCDRVLIENFVGPAAWAKRRVQISHPCGLREPVRGTKGRLAIQTGAECGEFVVKQRLLDPVEPISGEQKREGIGQGRMLQTRPWPLRDRLHELLTDGVAQNIGQHGEQVLHLELELKD